jgi:hypothetical protein
MGPASAGTILGGTGTYVNGIVRSLTINNASSVTLQTPLSIPSILTLSDGIFQNGTYLTMDNTNVGGSGSATFCQIRRTQHASLSAAYNLGAAAALYIVYNNDENAPSQAITEGHEIPVSRSLHSITVNNPDGVMINDNLTLKSSNSALLLTNGIIYLPTGKTLVCSNLSYSGVPGNSASFVDGAVALSCGTVAATRTFPVGSAGQNRKVTLYGVSSMSGTVAVRVAIHAAAGIPGSNMSSLSAARRWQCAVHSGNLNNFTGIGIDYGADDGDTQNRIAFSAVYHGIYNGLAAGENSGATVNAGAGTYGPGWYATGQDCSQPGISTIAGIKGTAAGRISIYPNPVTDVIHIVCPQTLKQAVRATLLDMRRSVIGRWLLPAGQLHQVLFFDQKPAAGIYLLILEGTGLYRSFKVIIL